MTSKKSEPPRVAWSTVKLIRNLAANYEVDNALIGRFLGIPRTTVRDIVLHKTWKTDPSA